MAAQSSSGTTPEQAAQEAGRQLCRFREVESVTASDIPVLFSSPGFVVVHKPYDLRLEGGEGTAESPSAGVRPALAALYGIKSPRWIHRLDYATSGCMAVGLTKAGSAPVAALFEQRLACKVYLALVEGHVPAAPSGTCDHVKVTPLSPHEHILGTVQPGTAVTPAAFLPGVLVPEDAPAHAGEAVLWADEGATQAGAPSAAAGGSHAAAPAPGFFIDAAIGAGAEGEFTMQVTAPGGSGRSARTLVQVLQHGYMDGKPVSRLVLAPRSGRRHQLRLHLKSIGHAIVGDVAYGSVLPAPRMCLHAWALSLPLNARGLSSKAQRSVRRNAMGLLRQPSNAAAQQGAKRSRVDDGSGAPVAVCSSADSALVPGAVQWTPPGVNVGDLALGNGKMFLTNEQSHWICGVPAQAVVVVTADPFVGMLSGAP